MDPYCDHCPGAIVGDVEHFFCTCVKVAEVWDWVREKLLGMMSWSDSNVSNWDMLVFAFFMVIRVLGGRCEQFIRVLEGRGERFIRVLGGRGKKFIRMLGREG